MNMPAACPRCGYDQSGAIASWNHENSPSCPLHGTCSECGLTFRWHDIIHADRLIVRGFIEHARGFWQRWRWAWVTWAWTLWPPVFWGRINMEHTPRSGVILSWPLLWAGPAFVGIALAQSGTLAYDMLNARGGVVPVAPLTDWLELLNPWTEWIAIYQWGTPRGTWHATKGPPISFLSGVLANAVAMLLLSVAPVTRRLAKVRREHIVRAGVYGLSCVWIMWPGEVFGSWSVSTLLWLQLAWLTLWWGAATREMFRERATDGVVIAIVIGALVGCGLGMSLSPRLVMLLTR